MNDPVAAASLGHRATAAVVRQAMFRVTSIAEDRPVRWGSVQTIRRGLLLTVATVCLFGAVITVASPVQSLHVVAQNSGAASIAPAHPAPHLCLDSEHCAPVTPLNGAVTVPPIVSIGFIAAVVGVLIGLRRRRIGQDEGHLAIAVRSPIFRPPIAT